MSAKDVSTPTSFFPCLDQALSERHKTERHHHSESRLTRNRRVPRRKAAAPLRKCRTALAPSRKTISSADRTSATSSSSLPQLPDTPCSLRALATLPSPGPAARSHPFPWPTKLSRRIPRELISHSCGQSRKKIRSGSPAESAFFRHRQPSPALASHRNHVHRAA